MDKLEQICANSYRNFHAKGLDYLCLLRSPSLTIKAYFFEGDLTKLPEIVVPHDHRYPFTTQVLSGRMANRNYREVLDGDDDMQMYQCFNYLTPLNGGDGFSWAYETGLHNYSTREFLPGDIYTLRADQIHTLDIRAEDTVAILCQFADVVPVGEPTMAYRLGDGQEAPSMDGLYDEMRSDDAIKRLLQLEKLGYRMR